METQTTTVRVELGNGVSLVGTDRRIVAAQVAIHLHGANQWQCMSDGARQRETECVLHTAEWAEVEDR